MTATPRLGHQLVPLTEGAAALLGSRRARRWVDGSELGFFELLGSLVGPATFGHGLFAVYPQVVDAQQLIQQVRSAARRGHSVTYLELVRSRVVRPITTTRCVREVDEILRLRAGEWAIDVGELDRFWHPLREHVRVVEVDTTIPYPPVLDVRAPHDRDLAQLATLLGIRAISWDLDLRDYALAEPFDLGLAKAMGELASGKCVTFVGIGLTAEASAAVVRLIRRCVGLARRHPLMTGVILLGAAVLIDRLKRDDRVVQRLATEWRPLLNEVLEAASGAMQFYIELSRQMPTPPGLVTTLPLAWNLARALAMAPSPASVHEISMGLQARGVAVSERQVREALRAQPEFFYRNARGQWQLGAPSSSR